MEPAQLYKDDAVADQPRAVTVCSHEHQNHLEDLMNKSRYPVKLRVQPCGLLLSC
jgi:hypothetical protein